MALLDYKLVTTLPDALIVAKIRNECREYMTQDKQYISQKKQKHWFTNVYKEQLARGTMKLYLVYLGAFPAGYGFIRDLEKEPKLTGCIREFYRSQGYGKQLFLFLIMLAKQTGHTVYLEVLQSNKIAYKLYTQLGFREKSNKNGVITMYL